MSESMSSCCGICLLLKVCTAMRGTGIIWNSVCCRQAAACLSIQLGMQRACIVL